MFNIFGRKRREEKRRRREAATGKPCSTAGGDGGYNPALYDDLAVNDSGPSHSPHPAARPRRPIRTAVHPAPAGTAAETEAVLSTS